MSVATVYLVGAGPGDPGLLTLRGAELLNRAQVVLYDSLANPALLRQCPQAQKIHVGKRAAAHTVPQEQIHAMMIEHARAGRMVVRLKGGDPFVFGRGGEECQALHDAGIPFEVVPGITAGIGASAYAGIPVTHRSFNSSFTFVTGHEKEEPDEPDANHAAARAERRPDQPSDTGPRHLDWAVLARLPALCFYMGVKSLPAIARNLIEHGMDPATPAATIFSGTLAEQKTVVGTLADLPNKVSNVTLQAPAMTIIGQVVSLRQTMNWFETRPLFGQTVVVTRSRPQISVLSAKLAELGASVIESPTIQIHPAPDTAALDHALHRAHEFDWVVFTSPNAADFVRQRLAALNLDARAFGHAKIAAIGSSTRSAIESALCLRVDLCPESFIAESLADAFERAGQVKGLRHLLLRAEVARPILPTRLAAGGSLEVRDVAVYQTAPASSLESAVAEALERGGLDWITFTSSSAVHHFMTLLGEQKQDKLAGVKLASIGPVTSDALRQAGFEPTVEANPFTISGLVSGILTWKEG